MNGVINIYKEQNMTSHDCVAILRRVTGIKRVGHTGTLDPMATGVLPICIGRSTRIMDYTDLDKKEYLVTFKLGIETDTMDIWGKVVEEKAIGTINEHSIHEVVKKFIGEINQIPPKFSALKVNGKKLYEYAREGKDVEIKPRKVNIYQLDVVNVELPFIKLRVLCSKGTYIRSLCYDISVSLGTVGAMTALERTKSGVFDRESAVSIMAVKEMSVVEVEKLIRPADFSLVHFGKINLDFKQTEDFLNGKPQKKETLDIVKIGADERFNIYGKDKYIGVGILEEKYLRVGKMLF